MPGGQGRTTVTRLLQCGQVPTVDDGHTRGLQFGQGPKVPGGQTGSTTLCGWQ